MQRQGYLTDTTDHQWSILEPAFGHPAKTGRPRTYSPRMAFDAILYLVQTGTQWRNLPNDFPPWQSVRYYFDKWKKGGQLESLNEALRRTIRENAGRKPEPTAGIIDSQSVDCPSSGEERGYDAGKNVKGRKRHLLTDVLGLVLASVITSASLPDRNGVSLLLASQWYPKTIQLIWADKGYRGPIASKACQEKNVTLEIVGNPDPHTFMVAKRRWVVERTNAWLSAARRLTVDREKTIISANAMIQFRLCTLYTKWVQSGLC